MKKAFITSLLFVFILSGCGDIPSRTVSVPEPTPVPITAALCGGDNMLTLPEKFAAENSKDSNTPALLVDIQNGVQESNQTTQADWQANTGESNVDYDFTAGDVRLANWLLKTLAATYPDRRYDFGMDIVGGDVYVFGGEDGVTSGKCNDLWKYTVATNTWTQLNPTGPPAARSGHTLTAYNNKLYVFGGYSTTWLNDIWVYDISANTWTQLTPSGTAPTVRRYHSAVASSAGKIYIWAGEQSGGKLNTLWEYNISTNAWAQKTPASPPSARSAPAAAVYSDIMYVFGGYSAVSPNYIEEDWWKYDIGANTWTQLTPTGGTPGKRNGHSMVASSNGNLFVYGGGDHINNPNTHPTDVWIYNVTGNSLTQKSGQGTIPVNRSYHRAVITSTNNMLVYGGNDFAAGYTYGCDDVWIYIGDNLSGYIYTRVMDLGSVPVVNGEWFFEDTTPAGTSVTYMAWASDTGAFAGEETSLGTVVDGNAINTLKRYYKVKATLTTNNTDVVPSLQRINAQFEKYDTYADNMSLGYEPSVIDSSSLTTTIDTFEKSTISQVTLTLALTQKVSEWLATKYPRNKTVKVKEGFVAPGWDRTDYIDYFVGQVEDWSVGVYEVKLVVRDYSKSWKTKVPSKWESTADDVAWTNQHPIDVCLDILRNRVNVRDSKLVTSSFDAVKTALSGWKVSRTITKDPIDADELLHELRLLMSAYFIPQPDGKIRIKRWDASEAAVDSLNDDNFIIRDWQGNAASLINQTHIYFGWDGDGGNAADFAEFRAGVDGASQTNWNELRLKEIKDKWTLAADVSQIQALEGKILARYANPPAIIPGDVSRSKINLEVGDIVTVTTKKAPSTDMNGISNVKFQVFNRNLDHKRDMIRLKLLRV